MIKKSKLLSFVLVFAMVISLVALPADAAASSENIIGKITGITDNTVTADTGLKASEAAAAPAWRIPHGTAELSSGVVSFTNRTKAHSALHYDNFGVKAGHTYYITASFRYDGDAPLTESNTARFYLTNSDEDNNLAAAPSGDLGTVKIADAANMGKWVKSSFTVEIPGASDTTGKSDLGLTLGIKAGSNSNASAFPFSVKNIAAFDITSSVYTNLLPQDTFPGFEDAVQLTSSGTKRSDLEENMTTESGAKTVGVTDEAAHNGYYSFKMTATGTENNMRFVNLSVTEGSWYRMSVWVRTVSENNDAAAASINVKNSGSGNGNPESVQYPVTGLTTEWQKVVAEFEAGEFAVHAGLLVTEGTSIYVDDFYLEEFTPSVTAITSPNLAEGKVLTHQKNTGAEVDASQDGTYYTLTKDETAEDSNARVQATYITVQPNKTYVISAKVRQNSEDSTTAPNAYIYRGTSGDNAKDADGNAIDACIKLGAIDNHTTDINKNDWTEVIGTVTIEEGDGWGDADGDGDDDDSKGQEIHAGILTNAKIIDIKDLQVRELVPLDNNAYSAVIREDGANANLYITGPESTLYFMAASYAGGRVTDIQFKKVVLEDGKSAFNCLVKGDNYNYFIWDSSLQPVNKVFSGLDF